MIAAQVECLGAGPPGQAGEPESCRQRGRHPPGREKPVLQTGMLVVDRLQRAHLALDLVALPAQPVAHRRRQVGRDAAGHDGVHHQAMPEGLSGQPQPVLAQARELGQAEGQRGVVAECAEVAQVVGDALAFEHQRAQPGRALGNLALPRRFQRHAIGPGVGHGRVARHPAGEPVRFQRRQLGEAALDALVHVAQVLLEPQHFLADDREAEVAGLDDAGVHRADGDLVHAIAFDAHEGVVGGQGAGARGCGLGALSQRRPPGCPQAVVQPRPLVATAVGVQARQVGHGALQAHGAGERGREVGEAGACIVERQFEPDQPFEHGIGGAGHSSAAGGTAVDAPHRDQSPPSLGNAAGRGTPRVAIHPPMPDRQRRGQALQVESQVRQRHRQFPSIAAAWRYQASR